MNIKNTYSFYFFLQKWPSILLLLCLSFAAFGQQYTFEKIGLEQGMPSARINDFIQDSRGFFWLATEGAGLVRYDGFEFKTISLGDGKMKPFINVLAEDRKGNIWLGNENALIRYNGLSLFSYYLPDATDHINKIVTTDANEIYVSGRKNIYHLGKSDTLEPLALPNFNRINDIVWSGDKLWIASDSGLFTMHHKIRPGRWVALAVNTKGILASGSAGLYQIQKNQWKVLATQPGEWACWNAGKQASLSKDQLFLRSDDSKDHYLTIDHKNGLPDEGYKGCFIDRAGVVWLFSNNGLVKLENTAIRFYDESNGINTEVYSVLADEKGRFFAGAANGLTIIDSNRISNLVDKKFPYGVVLALARYDGATWLGTERGLIRYDGASFKEITLPGSSGGYIFSLKGTRDALWIGTGSGIFSYSRGHVKNVSLEENMPTSPAYAISEGSDGSIWFATYVDGFIRKMGDSWTNVRRLGDIKMDSLRFNSFTAVNQNEIWAGTLTEGIFHITDTGSEVIGPALLSFAEVRSMGLDSDGNLWLGSNKGLTRVSRKTQGFQIKMLSGISQFLDEGCTPQAIDFKGEHLLAGTSEGLVSVDLAQLKAKLPAPHVAITDVQLFFGKVSGLNEYAQGLSRFTNIPKNLRLPHDLNFLSFTLAGLSGYHPQEITYRYRLKGQSDNWTVAGSRREAVYANLKPGHYTFEAQVARENDDWGSETTAFSFEILSPIWQRWWFIAALILALAAIVYIYLSDRIKRVNQRLRLENSLLEMEKKALRLQMNPHFIFNALDSISSFIFKNEPKLAVRYLNNFAKLMRLTLESSMEHLHPVETEVSVLKNYLELEKLRFQEKFDYEIELDEEIDYDVGIPPMLIQPHVENAILHGLKPKKDKGHLSIRFRLDGDLLICEIEDDGIGRKAAKELPQRKDHRSMATQINRDRLRLLRLSMSEEIDIEIIDKENPTGTKVILKLPAESI